VGHGEEGRDSLIDRRSVGAGASPRLTGPSSLLWKTILDSRRALVLAVGFLAFVLLTGAAAVVSAFGTAEARQEMVSLSQALPSVFQGLLGPAVGLDTLGGLIEWRYNVIIALLMPIWSIAALSSTIAGEASRGSLELVATTTLSRRRIALEKLFGHVGVVAMTMVLFAVMLWSSGVVFATLPGDAIAPSAAAGYAALAFLLILAPGAIAFAAAPFVGRGAAAGLAGFAMVVGYFVNGYRSSIALFETISPVSWFSWTRNHIPLAGRDDWSGLVALGVLVAALLIIGVAAFDRRDVGRTIRVPVPHLPQVLVGLRGPLGRTFGERIPTASAWGLGIGLYVLLIAATSQEMVAAMRDIPVIDQMMKFLYPDIDYTSVGGILQLVFIEFGVVVFGFAAATIVGGWASEETSGRLEVILAAPISRASWLVRTGLGAYVAILLAAVIVGIAAAVGAASQGSDPVAPAIGAGVLALYGLAWAGVGIAVGGLTRASLAAPTVIVLTVGTFLIALFATALKLPDWVADLALPGHYGRPMVGDWDPFGIVASLALAVGGLLVGAWGLSRRDVRG
jgi:ABC-2 type transport system permease protein